MAIIDDYASIAAELRRIQAERSPPREVAAKRGQSIGAYVTGRGKLQIDIRPGQPSPRHPVFGRRGWSTD